MVGAPLRRLHEGALYKLSELMTSGMSESMAVPSTVEIHGYSVICASVFD